MFVNGTGLYLRSNKQSVYDLSANLRKAANFTTDFSAVILTEDVSVEVYVGNTALKQYYPSMKPLVDLGQQFVYGYCPNTQRLTLYGYSFSGRYDLSNGLQHFSILLDFDQFTSTSRNTSSVVMRGTYRDQSFSMELFRAAGASAMRFGSSGSLSIVQQDGKGLWKSERLPVCRELVGYDFLSLYLETYAPSVGLYNEAGQLLWRFGKITDCSLTQQFEHNDVCLDSCPYPLYSDYFTWRCRVRCSSDLMVY